MNKLLQVYGKNAGAQTIVSDELTAAFPTLVEQFDMVNRIYEKFYDWYFPFVYTEDGGADMTWRANVRAWIAKNPKLADLELHFAQGTLSGTFTENIDDTDDTTFTDNRATKQKTTFKGVDTTSSGALADEVANEFEQGKNTTENARTYSRTRTYADGRNWVQVMQDVQKAEEPVYTFINSFARLLVSPTWCKQDFCEVLPPSVEMSVTAESLPTGSAPTAEIVNRGTPFNADWVLSLGLVAGETGPKGDQGDTGPQGPQGEPGPAGKDGTDGRNALIYGSTYETTASPNSGAVINLTNTGFSYTPAQNDYFLINWRKTSAGTSFVCVGRVESLGNPASACRILSFIETTGETGSNGLAALEVIGTFNLASVPKVGGTGSTSTTIFNRTPVVNDGFSIIATSSADNKTYAITCKVTVVGGTLCNYEYINVAEITVPGEKYCHNVNILTTNGTAISITLVNERSTKYNNLAGLQTSIFEAVGSIRAQTRFIPANGWLNNASEVRGLYIQQQGGIDTIMCLTGYNAGLSLGSILAIYDTIT